LLSQVDVDRLEAKLADGTIMSRLEAAIVCRPAGTTLSPPACQLEVFMGGGGGCAAGGSASWENLCNLLKQNRLI
jgi:hypothetical protein